MLNLFQQYAKAPGITLAVIIAVSILVLLEKAFHPTLASHGDFYPALLSFLVISSKTVIPLLLIGTLAGLNGSCLGWVNGGLWQSLWKGVVLAAGMMVFAGLYQKYSHLIFGTPYVSTGGSALGHTSSGIAIALLLTAALLNAFGEEIIFRGMLLPVLSNRFGIAVSLILQSLIFTLYHFFPLQNSVLLFFMGIFFALGYLWSGSLLTPVIAHLIENGTGSVYYLIRLLSHS
ncbi:MAG: type II CAAX endopeptidase family protein [Proteobacteria bacterium]|nr:type II CAAX endopeptidase family protein [Pseudomonadota bacterium]